MEKEILEELKKINLAIAYQTKLFEELFIKKDETQNAMKEKQAMVKDFISSVTDQLKSKGFKTDQIEKMTKNF